ncbi:MAG: formylglycine-generating enzyme family protein [Deinococcus sp.]|nr:formylglycine-generating enzyme family protein [Deinococcus sp.]
MEDGPHRGERGGQGIGYARNGGGFGVSHPPSPPQPAWGPLPRSEPSQRRPGRIALPSLSRYSCPGHAHPSGIFAVTRVLLEWLVFPPGQAVAQEAGSILVINEVDFVYVPAGPFTMGSDSGRSDELPVHQVTLGDYYIMRTEVTVAQYDRFVQATGGRRPNYRNSGPDHPAIDVDWNDATAFCAWLGQGSEFTTRLPTEAEWEKAARGTDGRVYPWGDSFDASLLNSSGSQDGFRDAAPVGQFPSGASPYGALDMAGNVWEWTSSLYQPYPYSADDGREDPSVSERRVVRGGSFGSFASLVRSAARPRSDPTIRDVVTGFRCVALESQ